MTGTATNHVSVDVNIWVDVVDAAGIDHRMMIAVPVDVPVLELREVGRFVRADGTHERFLGGGTGQPFKNADEVAKAVSANFTIAKLLEVEAYHKVLDRHDKVHAVTGKRPGSWKSDVIGRWGDLAGYDLTAAVARVEQLRDRMPGRLAVCDGQLHFATSFPAWSFRNKSGRLTLGKREDFGHWSTHSQDFGPGRHEEASAYREKQLGAHGLLPVEGEVIAMDPDYDTDTDAVRMARGVAPRVASAVEEHLQDLQGDLVKAWWDARSGLALRIWDGPEKAVDALAAAVRLIDEFAAPDAHGFGWNQLGSDYWQNEIRSRIVDYEGIEPSPMRSKPSLRDDLSFVRAQKVSVGTASDADKVETAP